MKKINSIKSTTKSCTHTLPNGKSSLVYRESGGFGYPSTVYEVCTLCDKKRSLD